MYWCGTFKLPPNIIDRIKKFLSRFLWSIEQGKGSRKVSRQNVTKLLSAGGLGLRDIEALHSACIMRLIWNIATEKESLRVKWIQGHYLKSHSIWTIPGS